MQTFFLTVGTGNINSKITNGGKQFPYPEKWFICFSGFSYLCATKFVATMFEDLRESPPILLLYISNKLNLFFKKYS